MNGCNLFSSPFVFTQRIWMPADRNVMRHVHHRGTVKLAKNVRDWEKIRKSVTMTIKIYLV